MQEHIRRAHPEHYIAKLPATEESFSLMVNTPPSERPPLPTSNAISLSSGLLKMDMQSCTELLIITSGHQYEKKNHYEDDYKSSTTPRSSDELRRASLLPAASAAAALAQLHYQRLDSDWDSEQVCSTQSRMLWIVQLKGGRTYIPKRRSMLARNLTMYDLLWKGQATATSSFLSIRLLLIENYCPLPFLGRPREDHQLCLRYHAQ